MKIKNLLLVAVVLGLMACSWVKLTPQGEKVRIASEAQVTSCQKLGQTTANVADRIVGLERKERVVKKNLEELARNAAAEMGGDAIVPATPIVDGTQSFTVYRCVGP